MKLIGTKLRYVMSYTSIALISCILIGLIFFKLSVNELNESATREQLNKLTLAAEYLENQQKLMMEIAYKIQNTIYYKPSQLKINKYKEIILLKDLELYKNYIPITQNYFLFYRDNFSVYGPSTTNTFKCYMQYIINILDYQSIYDRLNSVSDFTIICPEENENILFAAFPISLTGRTNITGDATLCFVVQKSDILQRINEVIGTLNGDIHIYYNNSLIVSSNTLEFSGSPKLSKTGLNPKVTEYIKSSSSSGNFTFALKVPETGIYERLDKYETFSSILMTTITIIMIIFAAFVSYYSYRPIKELVNQYESFFAPEIKNKNEIKQIALMLNSTFEKNRITSNKLAEKIIRLESHRRIIRQQFIQLLLSGEIDENLSDYMKYLDIPFPCPYYNVLIIGIGSEHTDRMEHLMTMVENLSDDSMMLYTVKLKYKDSFAVLTIMSEKTQMKEVKELIEAIGDMKKINLRISMGIICDDIKRIPESTMDALFKQGSEYLFLQPKQRDKANSFLYNDLHLSRMVIGLENGECTQTINLFEQFMDNVKNSSLSPVIQDCIFSEIVSMLIRVSYNCKVNIPQEKIGTLLLLKDADSFRIEATKLIIEMCTRIRSNIEEKEKNARLEIVEYINNHCGDYNIDLTLLSDKFDLSTKQISRIIKEITGMSYKEYLTSVRIELARKILIDHDLSVTEASKCVGFMNVSYFIRIFREMTGLTPAVYKMKYSSTLSSGQQNNSI